jgi:dynein light intermediate chain
MSNYVKTYLESPSLLLYQAKFEYNEDPNDNDNFLSIHKKKSLPPIESNPSEVETLNAMFLRREWEESGKKFIQYVSPEKASRDQAKDLFKALDEKIKERQAREKGICPVREELYAQCFDEIIRQVTIECPERGLLLLRVRDEIRMTIASYQTLYESAILFGIRKQLQAESGKDELKKRLEELEKKKTELTNRVIININFSQKVQLDNQLKALEKRISERYEIETQRREQEANFLKNQNENLEKFLTNRLDGKSA